MNNQRVAYIPLDPDVTNKDFLKLIRLPKYFYSTEEEAKEAQHRKFEVFSFESRIRKIIITEDTSFVPKSESKQLELPLGE